MLYFYKIRGVKIEVFCRKLILFMAFSLLGNKIGGINDITANHQCAFKRVMVRLRKNQPTSHNKQGGSNQYT